MKRLILTIISILIAISSFAEYDGKPWDYDEYKGISIGPLFLGIIIVGIIFYIIPKLASHKKKNNIENKLVNNILTHTIIDNSNLILCPKCKGKGIIPVERYICPYCEGYGHNLSNADKVIVQNALEGSIFIPKQIIGIPQEELDENEYDILDLLYHLPNPFVLRPTEVYRLSRTPKCSHCKGVGSVDTKLCTCFFDEQGQYTGHCGYIYKH